MCRNIRTLHNFEPPATTDEISGYERTAVRSRNRGGKGAGQIGGTIWILKCTRHLRSPRYQTGRRSLMAILPLATPS